MMSTGTPSSDSGETQFPTHSEPVTDSVTEPEQVPAAIVPAEVEVDDETESMEPVLSADSVPATVDSAPPTPAVPAATPLVETEPSPDQSNPDQSNTDEAATDNEPVTQPAATDESPVVPDESPVVPDEAAVATDEAASAESPPKRTVKLQPTIQIDRLRPVGSSDPVEQGVSSVTADAPIPKTATPVEIPKVDDLGADLEAQLAAAMSSDANGNAAAAEPAVSAETESTDEETLEPGSKLTGKVIQIHADNVFLDAGLRSNVIVPLRQFESGKHPAVGDSLEVIVANVKDEEGIIEGRLMTGTTKIKGGWDDVAVGQIVDCMVSKTNKGGLEVTVSTLRGFLPSSQVELGFCNDLEQYVGQKLQVQITEVNANKRNLVVSRRKLLQVERAEAEKGFWTSVEVGQTFTGRVKTVKNYGAFIDIGAVDGFLHIGEISWSHINHPNEVLKEGQTVEVKVLTVDPEKRRVGLGMRQLTQDPWASVSERYSENGTIEGTVTRATGFGAFVQLERGVEGLVHISQLAWRRVGSVKEVLNIGDTKEFKILEVDPIKKRISLSLKALEAKPETAKKEELQEDAPALVRKKRTEPLRGGTGPENEGGGLFGNPTDFGS
jgi:predicted RNA-binding protein with RPS1 domain